MSAALLLAQPEPFLERHLRSDGFEGVDDAGRPGLVLLAHSAAVEEYRARLGDVPVIVLGRPESDAVDRVRALERGCDDFLVRPFRALFTAWLQMKRPQHRRARGAGARDT